MWKSFVLATQIAYRSHDAAAQALLSFAQGDEEATKATPPAAPPPAVRSLSNDPISLYNELYEILDHIASLNAAYITYSTQPRPRNLISQHLQIAKDLQAKVEHIDVSDLSHDAVIELILKDEKVLEGWGPIDNSLRSFHDASEEDEQRQIENLAAELNFNFTRLQKIFSHARSLRQTAS